MHRWDCPLPWQARRQGERDYEGGRDRNPYRESCPDAARSWRRGYEDAELVAREEAEAAQRAERRRQEEARAQRRRQEWAEQEAAAANEAQESET